MWITYFILSVAKAEIVEASSEGFALRHQLTIKAERFEVFKASTVDIGEWWNDDYTISGSASNLRIENKVPGCFCELIGESGGIVHMMVTFINPGVIIRLTGGFGPLGLAGTTGNMTWQFEDGIEGTVLTLDYVVGGYIVGGLESLAVEVNGVLIDAMNKLKFFVENTN